MREPNSSLPGEPQAVTAAPIFRSVVGRQHAPGAAALGIEAPVAVPAADIEHGLAGEVELVELELDEAPQQAVTCDIGVRGRFSRPQPVGKVELVIPAHPVDPGLQRPTGPVVDPDTHCIHANASNANARMLPWSAWRQQIRPEVIFSAPLTRERKENYVLLSFQGR
jgi:hypothetical protein